MDFKKIPKIVFLILTLVSASISMAGEWQNFTSRKFANEMKIINDSLFVVTDGGLVKAIAVDIEPAVMLNNDGLGTNLLTDVVEDDAGAVWMTGMGHLIKADETGFHPYILYDNDDAFLSLTTIENEGDFLWLGCSFGLVLFSKLNDGGQIEDSYTLFGDLNPEPTVYDIELQGDTIFIATSSGLAWADKSDLIQLKSPFAWHTVTLDNFPQMLLKI